MSPIRFGIMGAGRIAEKFVHAARLTDGVCVTAVASKSPERARAFALKNELERSCTYDELLADRDIDAVYVATTHNFHYENVKACLLNGKHVLCEKAMVLHEEEARELFDLARNNGLFLMEAMWSRFLPSIQKARHWIEEGKIGRVHFVSGAIGFKGDTDVNSRLLAPELAGGALYDIGVYLIEITSYLVGKKIKDVMGTVRRDARTGVDVNDSFILSFDGVDALLNCALDCNYKQYLRINGENGYIEIPDPHVTHRCTLYNTDGSVAEEFSIEFPEGNGFVYELRETVACINTGKTESDTMKGEVTIECAEVFERLLA